MVADALSIRSRKQESQKIDPATNTLHVSQNQSSWEEEVSKSYVNDEFVAKLSKEFEGKNGEDGDWELHDGIISKKGRLYVGIAAAIRKKVMEEFHNTPIGGHSGMQSTYQRIKRGFYWPGIKREICSFVRECGPGLLQPLPIPDQILRCISMDFREVNPRDVILVVIDRLTKYAHFMAPFSAPQVARVFMENICKLHGMPYSIVSDRERISTSQGRSFLRSLELV